MNDRSRLLAETAPVVLSTRRKVQEQGTAEKPSEDTWHAVATVYRVVGTRGRSRSVIVVGRCPWCSRPHVHSGKPDFTTGKRTASCHAGRYLVHTGALEGER